ncbi:hypothetical protein TNCV_2414121 [Trichonephila clavipes]|nr:hypothetical protein TNCV_2414121 [Trichonephila clavipes]
MLGLEEESLQSSWTQQGRSIPYSLRRRRGVTKEVGSRPSGRAMHAHSLREEAVWSTREPFSRPSPYLSNQPRQSRQQGCQQPEKSLKSR